MYRCMNNLIIVGSGGHCGVVIDAVRALGEYNVCLLMDDTCVGQERHGFKVQPITDEFLHVASFIAIGDNKIREELSKKFELFTNIIYPTAIVSKQECHGTYLGANSIIGNNSKVGNFSIINTGVILEHDCKVGEFSHLAPAVVTGGRVKIGSRTTIGLGSILQDGITIGSNVIIGMGSVVTKDVPDNEIWWGSPAEFQRLKK